MFTLSMLVSVPDYKHSDIACLRLQCLHCRTCLTRAVCLRRLSTGSCCTPRYDVSFVAFVGHSIVCLSSFPFAVNHDRVTDVWVA